MSKKFFAKLGVFLLPVILFFIFMVITPSFGFHSLPILISQCLIPTVMGLGMAVLMQTGLSDFTIGGRLVFAAICGGFLSQYLGFAGFILGCLIGALLVSAVVGLLYRILRIPSMIVSMGFILLCEVVNYEFSGSFGESALLIVPDRYIAPFGYPFSILWVVAACVVFYVMMYHTKIGFHINTVGSDEVLALSIGVVPKKVKMRAYLLSAFFIALAAFLQAGATGLVSVQLNMLTMNVVFKPMMGVMIGMTLTALWDNLPLMILIGEMCISLIFNGLIAMGLPDSFQNIVLGVFLLVVLGFSGNAQNMKERSRKQKVRKESKNQFQSVV